MKHKIVQKDNEKLMMQLKEERANQLMKNDQGLMSVYPRIKGIPDDVKKE